MCEIFPELKNCCGCLTLRMASVFIGIISIMTGSAGLSGLHQKAKWDYDKVNSADVTGIFKRSPLMWIPEFVKRSNLIAPLAIAFMSIIYMLSGVLVFYSALFDREDVIQVGIWGLMINSALGLICIFGVSLQCLLDSKCFFGSMDWVSQTMLLLIFTGYLIAWLYFVIVINSYVVTKYD